MLIFAPRFFTPFLCRLLLETITKQRFVTLSNSQQLVTATLHSLSAPLCSYIYAVRLCSNNHLLYDLHFSAMSTTLHLNYAFLILSFSETPDTNAERILQMTMQFDKTVPNHEHSFPKRMSLPNHEHLFRSNKLTWCFHKQKVLYVLSPCKPTKNLP